MADHDFKVVVTIEAVTELRFTDQPSTPDDVTMREMALDCLPPDLREYLESWGFGLRVVEVASIKNIT
jgi:hypothetical protein